MFSICKIQNLQQYFIPLSQRNCIYVTRIAGTSPQIQQFLLQYFEAAKKNGVVLYGKIQNPDQRQLQYFEEMMGNEFQMSEHFLQQRIAKWLPRLSVHQRQSTVTAMYSMLSELQRKGKNENILKNAYIKYMCWLYYKFERILAQLGTEQPPKILYDGIISTYELQLIVILSRAGADVVLLECAGDSGYLQIDAKSEYSTLYTEPNLQPFSDTFSLQWLQEQQNKTQNIQRLYGTPPSIQRCTNAWFTQPSVKEFCTPIAQRGNDASLFYNGFILQYGIEEPLTASHDFFELYQCFQKNHNAICVVNGQLSPPTPQEISQIARKQYQSTEQAIFDLSQNLVYGANTELQRMIKKAFFDVLIPESESKQIQKVVNTAVYLICWWKRYQTILFQNWKSPQISMLIWYGASIGEKESLFVRMMAQLPIDVWVVLLQPNATDTIQDDTLLTLRFAQSLTLQEFPIQKSGMKVTTTAYQAERQLDTLLYQNSGMYRNHQYQKADILTLQTTYEEIGLLWNEELKYRTGFDTKEHTVIVPVLFCKICGVANGDITQYWADIKKLITPDTIVMEHAPHLTHMKQNPYKSYVFFQNGKVQKQKIKSHPQYPYQILREELQEYLLDAIQIVIDQNIIKGTFENGTEHTIVATALHLDKEILRMIQKFDFTKKNPKLIWILTTEQTLSLEDSILVALLHTIGFDIVFYVPTGYQCIEQHFRTKWFNEYQIGEYLYDLSIPNWERNIENTVEYAWDSIKKLFGRSR